MFFSVPGYPNQPYEPDLLVFVSFSMPKESLQCWAEQASRLGCPLLLRGFVENDLTKTTAKTYAVFGEKPNVEVLVDPERFDKFKIDVVPAVVMVEPTTKEVEYDMNPPFDIVYGDTSLEEALKRISTSGSLMNQKAASHLLKKYRDQHE